MNTLVKQRTIQNTVNASGIGLHSGLKVHLTIKPADPNTGIIFTRIDVTPNVRIKAHTCNVSDTKLATTLEKDGARVATIEHLMSALAGLGIDNAIIEIDAPEVPIMDGSATVFVFLLQSAGIVEQDEPKNFIRILKTIEVMGDGDKFARFVPYDGFKINFTIGFDHPVFHNTQCTMSVDFSGATYLRDISRARTFGFKSEIDELQAQNLALGGSYENAVVIGESEVLNESGVRQDSEFINHKILDAVGDLYLLGHTVLTEFTGHKTGHDFNNRLLSQVWKDQSAWEIVQLDNEDPMIQFLRTQYS